ncbi:hypothetical protein [Arthrobacter burdickii]|uniref:Uncharacterized protein n=1 Tax=Arthrobacter burdickii TaxID=3035920 RepID=A0ABT8JYH0_9MICC|nr:hypothetical protein [Arthrobacter burdickii]MDN4610218.1 hypothetical protein [Arthrobacter burdickii]
MSTQRPSVSTPSAASRLPRTTLLMMPGGRDAPGAGALADHLAAETEGLLDSLEGTVARLALAHRSCIPDPCERAMDDEAFAWVQQSLEDISATLRGLTLGRATDDAAPIGASLRTVTGSA